jgi:uncharacterized membrane protein YeaQ/YmgE (transglycosylase-associated protein family)
MSAKLPASGMMLLLAFVSVFWLIVGIVAGWMIWGKPSESLTDLIVGSLGAFTIMWLIVRWVYGKWFP